MYTDSEIKVMGEDLEKLCRQFISLLDKMKDNGTMGEEEYRKHTIEKIKFLESMSSCI